MEGGSRVVVLYEDQVEYDTARWHIEQGAWNHEHCGLCQANIPPMTLCWVTESGPYVLLCEACHPEIARIQTRPRTDTR